MARIGPEDVWIYVYERGEARYTDLIRRFVDGKKCAKPTLLKYKLRLEAEGKIAKKLSEKTGGPVYYVPDYFKLKVATLKDRQEFKGHIDKMTPEQLIELKKELLDSLTGDS